MRKALFACMLVAAAVLIGCGGPPPQVVETVVEPEYEDGTYRGTFADEGIIQVNVQFKLARNIVTEIRYRYLSYKGNCLEAPWGPQYEQAIQHLVGKDLRKNLNDLYTPGNFVKDVDGFTGATIRSVKVRSAIKDGLNRDPYSK